ncbi:DeoR/GlpR family DNA-binding transcription regulator [Alicyclobacillus ferrooxydans]|uniref:DeoR faimly transcriptional regulator n=1 Tax=Alicyclobacillus ferrooxydans TaxID=471514 RepID=A0A0P9GQG7_9BACL|nr:DeoR/GlpR family DNA-binding transcription regulator [Alicyclobacillus ferrooxydans]KPV43057.1 DeoR faimly transcriptional regulator [Alicyclobacillus ferrooxydans]
MFSDERKAMIVAYLSEHRRLTVAEVAAHLDVSETTIRRDLHELEHQGLLRRTHGGAVGLEVAGFEPSVQEKSHRFAPEKSRIATRAQQFIRPGDTVLLDSGTTTLEIAKALPDIPITVVTNSLAISAEMAQREKVSVVMLGGELRKTTGAFVGPFAERMLGQVNVDKLFLGMNGIDIDRGLTTVNAIEASTKKAMIASAREVFLVTDFSKFDQVYLVTVGDLGVIDTLICDSPLPPEYHALCVDKGIEVVIAQEQPEGEQNE